MAKFSPGFLDNIRDSLTLSDIVGQKVKLTRAGREFKGCCPFHNEKTASFYVNNDKQFYHCFGCGAHGDAIRFMVDLEGLSFPEAVEQLAGKAGVPMPIAPVQTAADYHYQEQRKGLYELLDEAGKWFCQQLYAAENKVFLDYMVDRGVAREMLSDFLIGCAPDDPQALPSFLKAQGYSEQQMIESGLCKESKKGGMPYAFFRERIMFPVRDRKGRIVTFGGRVLPDHIRASAGMKPHSASFTPPKYINGADTSVFYKGRMLYGEYHSRQAGRESHTPIVVEGYLDVIACHQAGFKGAVAPMGTALTEEQIQLLWQMGARVDKTPLLCFDGDNAGLRAAERAMERILPHVGAGRSVNFSFMPKGEDPDSLIKAQGPDALKAIFTSALSLVDYLWQVHAGDGAFTTPEARAQLETALYGAVEAIDDEQTKGYYRRDIKDRLYKKFSAQRFAAKGKKFNKGRQERGVSREDRAKAASQAVLNVQLKTGSLGETLQRILLVAALYHGALLERFYDEMERRHFDNADLERLKSYLLDVDCDKYLSDMTALRDDLIGAGFSAVLKALDNQGLNVHAPWLKNMDLPEHQIIEYWQATINRLNHIAHEAALADAVRALEQDFTQENADRLTELQKMRFSE